MKSNIEAMDVIRHQTSCIFLFILFFALPLLPKLQSQPFDYPTANLSTLWTNAPNIPHTISYPDGSLIKALLLRGSPQFFGPSFACGFYCGGGGGTCDSFLFAIFIVYTNSGARITLPNDGIPQVVWSANRNRPVKENATLELKKDGDLVLNDVDGTLVWSTNTSGRSVVGMNMTETGNLMLFDKNNLPVWQSFDHPTDTLLPGQKLVEGQRLTTNTSTSNTTQGELYLSVTSGGWAAFVASSPPQLYYEFGSTTTSNGTNNLGFVRYMNGSLGFFVNSTETSNPDSTINLIPAASAQQYMRLEFDGHLRVYGWGANNGNGWSRVQDVMNIYQGDCAYPTVCGEYGVCLNGQCSCPSNGSRTYFQLVNGRNPSLGCAMVTPLSCQSSQNHQFLTLTDVSYFNYIDDSSVVPNLTTVESCKEACLGSCSCKAALFQYGTNVSVGRCHLPSEIFSLMNNQQTISHYNSTAYVKVQVPQAPPAPVVSTGSPSKPLNAGSIVGIVLGVLFGVFIVIGITLALLRKRRGKEEDDEDDFGQFPGTTMRFSYEEMRVATQDFFKKLGGGGFGSVFEGKLLDGTKIAVKRLDNIGQGKKEFLSEVETIGSIHHLNLVRLVGFCAEKSHRLLVY